MAEIILSKNITPSKIKDLYETSMNQQNLKDVTLTIPNSINKYTFGLLADILKFIITLNNKTSIKVLKIDIDLENIDFLYDQEYAYPIISLLWNTADFVDKNNLDIKAVLREKQNIFFIAMNSLAKIKGNKYTLTHTDHLSKNRGLVRLLESSFGFNDDEEQITNSIKKILYNNVLTFNKNNKIELEKIIEDIGAIVYELAKNTYEWGKTDSNSIDIPASIRGVYFRFHINKDEKIQEDFYNTPLEQFFKHPVILKDSLNNQKKIYYLEILIFDSGVGFIDKFNEKNDLNDLQIIKKCLVKNQTSSISNLKSKKGLGLDRILNILNKKGFIRISTDKYCVYRDLIKDNYSPIEINQLESLKLDDWNNNSFNIESVTKSQGSYLSILYPFKSSN